MIECCNMGLEALRYAFIAMKNPRRADAVAKTGELFMKSCNEIKLQQIYNKMQRSITGRRILQAKPAISSQLIKEYPSGSFGEKYIRFVETHGFNFERPKVSTELKHPYVLQRYREIHDFNHVLYNLSPTVHGESILKWIEYQQLEMTMPLFAGIVGIYYNLSLDDVHYGLQQGYSSNYMMNIFYEEHLNEDLDKLRLKLNIKPYCAK
eukprot:NODE_458_length_8223_cov_0.302683.p4 type:complete len:208 gc:universal NODE_458_length_8223_cov_0.302683:7273-6650(-)